MKLFTIGDSISQGFMSGAAARTDQSYSTLLSKILNAQGYCFPDWQKGGQPVNIETAFRRLEKRLGANIAGPFEWPIAFNIINHYLDEVEDYYERGEGWATKFTGNPYHNVAVRGFDISSPWMINPELCRRYINTSPGAKDNRWGLTDESFLRTAVRVLEPGSEGKLPNPTQLDWLNYHHQEEGVENLIIWLGANNALGTVTSLKINQTSIDGTAFSNGPQSVDFDERRKKDWNLWHPEDFRVEYQYLMDQVVDIMEKGSHNYKIFIGTVPLVTIVPLIKGVGGPQDRTEIKVTEWYVDQDNPAPTRKSQLAAPQELTPSYAKYYPYFAFADNFDMSLPHLNLTQALHVDNTIRQFNRIIQEIVAAANEKIGASRIYLVDISAALSKMALKRNNYAPVYEFPSFFDFAYPKVDTRYYSTTREGEIKAGGLFSLDGVHPSAVGQGLIAYEFLKVMKKAGSFTGVVENALDWATIFKSDDLLSNPIKLMSEIYDNIDLKKWLFKIIA
jgi:hypothetical protein